MMRYVYKLGIMTLIAASIFAVFFAWLCEEPLASDEFKKLIMEAIRPTLKKAVMGGLIMIFSYFVFFQAE